MAKNTTSKATKSSFSMLRGQRMTFLLAGILIGIGASYLATNRHKLFTASSTKSSQATKVKAGNPKIMTTMVFASDKLRITYPESWFHKTDDPLYDDVLSDSSETPNMSFVLSMVAFENGKSELGCSDCKYTNDHNITLTLGGVTNYILSAGAYDNKVSNFVLSSCPDKLCLPVVPGTKTKFYYELVHFGRGGPASIDYNDPDTQQALTIMRSLQSV